MTSSHDWNRIKQLFGEATELGGAERAAFLAARAEQEPVLVERLRALLAEHTDDDDFLRPRWLPKFEDFEIRRELGSGGMGVVYLAHQKSLDRLVALKVMRNHLGADESQILDFRQEAAKAARMRHPAIVQIYSVSSADEVPYIVMEYIPGKSLKAMLDEAHRNHEPNTPLDVLQRLGPDGLSFPARVAEVCAELADALDYSHSQGIVHRDIKPGNILIDYAGRPHIVDFGLAKRLHTDSRSSKVVGTPYYMSPEQARIHDVNVDARTDVYSLGLVLYEMLTLTRPFERETYTQVIQAIQWHTAPFVRKKNPDVPVALETICGKAIRKNRAARYASAADFSGDLRRFLRHLEIVARPESRIDRAKFFASRHRTIVVASTLALVAVACSLWLWSRWARERDFSLLPDPLSGIPASVESVGQAETILAGARTAHERVDWLRTRYTSLRASEMVRLEAVRRWGEKSASQVVAFASAEIARGQRASDPGAAGVDLRSLTRVATLLANAADLLPDKDAATARALLDALLPRVTIRTRPSGARIFVQALDRQTGLPRVGSQRRLLGISDLEAEPLSRGYYHIVAMGDDGRTGELTRYISENTRLYVLPTLYLRSTSEARSGMKPVGAGELVARAGVRAGDGYPALRGTYSLPRLLVDEFEVTNGEYRKFCDATGHPYPKRWPDPATTPWKPAWNRLPVVWIDYYDAEAFAAWAGKRLPTQLEWNYFARGRNLLPYPWGTEMLPRDRVLGELVVRHVGATGLVDPLGFVAYVAGVKSVDSLPANLASPFGIRGVFDNVAEWTASLAANPVDSGFYSFEAGLRVVRGNSWRLLPRPLSMQIEVAADAKDCAIGFRCVRSFFD